MIRISWLFILFVFWGTQVFAFDHSHKMYDAILKKYVSNGRIDYKSLKSESNLKLYLDSLSFTPKKPKKIKKGEKEDEEKVADNQTESNDVTLMNE